MGVEGRDGDGKVTRFPLEVPYFIRELDEVTKKARKLSGKLNLEIAVEQNRRRRTEEVIDRETLAYEKILNAARDGVGEAYERAEEARQALKSRPSGKDPLEKAKEAKAELEAALVILETCLKHKQ